MKLSISSVGPTRLRFYRIQVPELLQRARISTREEIVTKDLQRLAREGVERRVKRRDRNATQEFRDATAFEREIIRNIRSEGGIRPAEGVEEEVRSRLPRSLVRKRGGVASDELAQEFADRGMIQDASLDSLLDFLEKTLEAIERPEIDKKKLRAEARRMVDREAKRISRELTQGALERCLLERLETEAAAPMPAAAILRIPSAWRCVS